MLEIKINKYMSQSIYIVLKLKKNIEMQIDLETKFKSHKNYSIINKSYKYDLYRSCSLKIFIILKVLKHMVESYTQNPRLTTFEGFKAIHYSMKWLSTWHKIVLIYFFNELVFYQWSWRAYSICASNYLVSWS